MEATVSSSLQLLLLLLTSGLVSGRSALTPPGVHGASSDEGRKVFHLWQIKGEK